MYKYSLEKITCMSKITPCKTVERSFTQGLQLIIVFERLRGTYFISFPLILFFLGGGGGCWINNSSFWKHILLLWEIITNNNGNGCIFLFWQILDTPSLLAEGSKGVKKNIFKEKPPPSDASTSGCCWYWGATQHSFLDLRVVPCKYFQNHICNSSLLVVKQWMSFFLSQVSHEY